MKQLKSIFPLSHPQHVTLSLSLIVIGIILIFNDHFFFWPPLVEGFTNDNLVGGAGVAIGVGILTWALKDKHRINTNRNLLVASSVFWGFLVVASLIDGIVGHNSYLLAVSSLATMALVFTYIIIAQSRKD